MTDLSFTSVLERDKDGTWWYVHVPRHVREALKHLEKRGSVPVVATIGQTSWEGSLLPWADGSAQLVVKKPVRTREGLELGQTLDVRVRPR